MALIPGGDLEIDKVLIWKTDIPFENIQRQSPYFKLMGLEWCLRFSYQVSNIYQYHVITLHRVIDGLVADATIASSQQPLNKRFGVKTSLVQQTTDKFEEKGAMHTNTSSEYNKKILWHAGDKNTSIFKSLPGLYNCSEVEVVCKFYGQPLSTFQLGCTNSSKLDKSVQVSSEVPMDFQTLSSDFSDLLEKEMLPDVKLECGGQTFQAHRSILAARSNVFQAMFQNKMLESETGTVKIQDVDVSVLLILLKFIYSGKSEDLSDDNTSDLYEAADKYDVISLKTACSYWMIRNLNEGNCVNFLQVATSHSDSDLKDATVSFIVGNPHVMISASWLSLSKELPLLANEVLQAYCVSTIGSRCNQSSVDS